MEIRISRILSEYYDYTRREAEEYIRANRVKKNGQPITIGDKATVDDTISLDDVPVPLKGIFRKVQRENAKSENNKFSSLRYEDLDELSPDSTTKKSKSKKGTPKPVKKGKNAEAGFVKYKHRNKSFDKDVF